MSVQIKSRIENPDISPDNELYFSDYIRPVEEEADPESIDFKGTDSTDEEIELRVAEGDSPEDKTEDYNNNYLKE